MMYKQLSLAIFFGILFVNSEALFWPEGGWQLARPVSFDCDLIPICSLKCLSWSCNPYTAKCLELDAQKYCNCYDCNNLIPQLPSIGK